MAHRIAVLAGDGIGPEVTQEAVRVLQAVGADVSFEEALFGGAAFDAVGHPLPSETLDLCRSSSAVLFGAVGGPKWDSLPLDLRPEIGGLLPLRKALNLYANLRPARAYRALADSSPLRNPQFDLMVVRELTGGIYFGKPSERRDGGETAIDTCVYSRHEVERIAKHGFEVARQRRGKVCSVDKANVLETSRLWRETVTQIATHYPDVELSHMLVDNCAMQLVRAPEQFDVILTENLFGDILSDEASMLTGSLGMLPSASMSDPNADSVFGLYEPIHGSAPDIAGQDRANPIAAILSAAMLLRYSLRDDERARQIEQAVEAVLAKGLRTSDLSPTGFIGTRAMGDAICSHLHS